MYPLRRGTLKLRDSGTRLHAIGVLGAIILTLSSSSLSAVEPTQDPAQHLDVQRGPEVGPPVTPIVLNVDVRDLPSPGTWKPGDPLFDVPKRSYSKGPERPDPIIDNPDPLAQVQKQVTSLLNESRADDSAFVVPNRNFQTFGFNGANVPDPSAEVGSNHFITSINASRIRIYDKAEPTPNLLADFALDSLGNGICGSGVGDPIVIYDEYADRWMLSEFSGAGNALCMYISQTADPVSGGWFAYIFNTPNFPDYPKYGVWPTDVNGGLGSYVVTTNEAQPAVYAMDRGNMLAGTPASLQRFTLPGLSGFNFDTRTPADADGPLPPPTGTPAIIMAHRDTEAHGGPPVAGDVLELWHFQVDWNSFSNTSLIKQPDTEVADFDSSLCGLTSFSCFPQPGTGTVLDPLREVIMNKLQYINLEGQETLVGNYVTDVNGANQGGIRWFEMRREEGVPSGWSLFQEGTYAPDSENRWMGASIMDQSGNIALAYSIGSTSTFPGLRYTGRLADDPAGVMTQTETVIRNGTASETNNRFGDYHQMSLDPVDNCTFWFIGEMVASGGGGWAIQAASFRFDSCGCEVEPSTPNVVATDQGANLVQVSWDDSQLSTVIEYEIQRSRSIDGPFETIAIISDSSPDQAGGPDYRFDDTDVSGGIEYFYSVVASDGGACRTDTEDVIVSAVASGRCTLRPLFAGANEPSLSLENTCQVGLSWDAAVPECAGPVLYNVYRSTTPGFLPGPANLLASGIPGTSIVDFDGLQLGQEYFYVVRALDTSNLIEDLNIKQVSSSPNAALSLLIDNDFSGDDALDGWTLNNLSNHRCGEFTLSNSTTQRPAGGEGQYVLANSEFASGAPCDIFLPITATRLDTPSFDISSAAVTNVSLGVDLYYNHANGDNASIEVFDGANWVPVWQDSNADFDDRLVLDVTSFANANFQVRFSYTGASDDLWYAFDNVQLAVQTDQPCTTVQSPPPAPNGSGATTGVQADRLTFDGSQLEVTWDATTCTAPQYNLLVGSLSNVAATTLNDGVCGIGNGSFTWAGVPAGNLFFLVVSSDGAAEGSWGDSTFGERNGLTPSGFCSTTLKAVSATCP